MQLHSKVFEVRKHLTLIQERFILNVSSTMASGGDKSKVTYHYYAIIQFFS